MGNKPAEVREKLLVGLNMYGSLFTPSTPPRRAIIGSEYVKFLEMYKPKMEWDSDSEESYFECSTDDGTEGELWYPSLYSIKYIPFLFNPLFRFVVFFGLG